MYVTSDCSRDTDSAANFFPCKFTHFSFLVDLIGSLFRLDRRIPGDSPLAWLPASLPRPTKTKQLPYRAFVMDEVNEEKRH